MCEKFFSSFPAQNINNFTPNKDLLKGLSSDSDPQYVKKRHRDILQGKVSNWIRGGSGWVSFLLEPSTY